MTTPPNLGSETWSCPFCARIATGPLLLQARLAVAIEDRFPLSPGHSLVLSRRHEADFFALGDEELDDVVRLAVKLQHLVAERYRPDGFNVGINIGEAAGQTVAHVHVHVIPRYWGDVADPRGGIRWVIPERAPYWSLPHQPGGDAERG